MTLREKTSEANMKGALCFNDSSNKNPTEKQSNQLRNRETGNRL